MTFPVLLDDMPSPVLSAYPKPTVIAEKLEAIVRFGRVNSRRKDCFDLWILLVTADADRLDVTLAIAATFARRNTPIPATTPSGLTDEFAEDPRVVAQWRAFTKRNQLSTPDITETISQLRAAVMPLCAMARHDQPEHARWRGIRFHDDLRHRESVRGGCRWGRRSAVL